MDGGMDFDPTYEYEAPMYRNFNQSLEEDPNIDSWFDKPTDMEDRAFGSGKVEDEMEAHFQEENAFEGSHQEAEERQPSAAGKTEEPPVKKRKNLVTSWASGAPQPTAAAAAAAAASTKAPVPSARPGIKRAVSESNIKRSMPAKPATPKQQAAPAPSAAAAAAAAIRTTPTIPKTPEMMKRQRSNSVKAQKTSEELEAERIMNLRREAMKMRKVSQSSFMKVQASSDYVPVRSNKPLTEPKEFDFHTEKALKRKHSVKARGMDTDSAAAAAHEEAEIEALKRGEILRDLKAAPVTEKVPLNKVTKPRPFQFNLKQSLQSCAKPFIAMAQQVEKFVTKTPERFHKPANYVDHFKPQPKVELQPTIPMSPAITKPKGVSNIKSTEELEAEMLANVKPFKAAPIDPNKLHSRGDYGVPRVQKKELTVPESPHFVTEERIAKYHETHKQEEEPRAEFHAHEFPAQIFEAVTGVPAKRPVEHTIPQSPAITKLKHKPVEVPEEPIPEPFKAQPLPDFSERFAPQLPHKATEAEPFPHVSSHPDPILKRQALAEEEERKLAEARKFHANPIPDYSTMALTGHVEHKPSTIPQPFQLEGETYRQVKLQIFQERVQEEAEEERRKRTFHARPASVLHEKAFEPAKVHKPLTEIAPFSLNTESRATQRSEYDKALKAKELQIMEEERKKEELRKIEEEKEIKALRQQIVHKAQPVRKYRPTVVSASEKPLTEPMSPMFVSKKRPSTGASSLRV